MTILVCNTCGKPWKRRGNPAVCPQCGISSFAISVAGEKDSLSIDEVDDRSKVDRQSGQELPMQTSSKEGSVNMTMQQIVADTLAKYRHNEVMLDAFLQWATNPTTQAAGYGVEENYPYIRKNLEIRYGLSREKAQGYVDTLRIECDSIIEQTQPMSDRQHQIRMIQDSFKAILIHSENGDLLTHGIMERLKGASPETKQALIVFNALYEVNDYPQVNLSTFTDPPGPRNEQAQFQAYYKSLYGETCNVSKVAREMVSIGVCNDMYWVGYSTSKKFYPSHPMRTRAILPTIDELESLGTKVPPKPDILEMLNSYRDNGEFELLRLLDIVSHASYGVVTEKPLPARGDRVGILGRFNDAVAVSPLIKVQMEEEIDLLKQHVMNDLQISFVEHLWEVDKYCVSLGQGGREVLFKLGTVEDPLYVYVTPWLRDFNDELTRQITSVTKSHILLVVPYQSKQSLIEALREVPYLSTTNNRGENSIGLLYPLDKPAKYETLVGQQHQLISQILKALSGEQIIINPSDLKAEFSASPTEGKQPLTVHFNDLSTPEEVIVSWNWDFGDGNGSSEQNPAHEYEAQGAYTVSLTVIDTSVKTSVESKRGFVTVVPPGPREFNNIFVGSSDLNDTDRGFLGWSGTSKVELDMFIGKKRDEERAHTISVFGIPKYGKSYTLGVILEMAVLPQPGIRTGPPLPAVVFHYDKNVIYKPEFANLAYPATGHTEELQSEVGIKPAGISDMVVLVPPWTLKEREKQFPDAKVMPLTFSPKELSQSEWQLLMGVPGSNALYVNQVKQILLELSIGGNLDLKSIQRAVEEAGMSSQSKNLAIERLNLASRWIQDDASLNTWLKPGRLTILDIRDNMIDPSDAMRLCLISLGLFQQAKDDNELPIPKMIFLDEAHKYVQKEFADEIVTVVNQMRHTATTVVIASQNPDSIPSDVLEKSSIVMLHRLTSPNQAHYLKKAVHGLSKVPTDVVTKLKKGEAMIWATESTDTQAADSGIRVQIRPRFTRHV